MKNYNNNVLQDVDKKQERGKFNEKNYCIIIQKHLSEDLKMQQQQHINLEQEAAAEIYLF